MSREIKFRGKRVDNGEWVYGYYLHDPETTLMKDVIYSDRKFIKVIPETVGQFTGIHDINGKEIYEADILKGSHFISKKKASCYIHFTEAAFRKTQIGFDYKGSLPSVIGSYIVDEWNLSVIGNIHDNPELLKP